MTEEETLKQERKRQHDDYVKRIQEARERGDRATELQLQQELNYMDDARYSHG